MAKLSLKDRPRDNSVGVETGSTLRHFIVPNSKQRLVVAWFKKRPAPTNNIASAAITMGALRANTVTSAPAFGILFYVIDNCAGDIAAGDLLNAKAGAGIDFQHQRAAVAAHHIDTAD